MSGELAQGRREAESQADTISGLQDTLTGTRARIEEQEAAIAGLTAAADEARSRHQMEVDRLGAEAEALKQRISEATVSIKQLEVNAKQSGALIVGRGGGGWGGDQRSDDSKFRLRLHM